MRISAAEWLIAAAAGLLLFGVLAVSLAQVAPPARQHASAAGGAPPQLAPSATLGQAFLGVTDATPPAEVSGTPLGAARPRRPMNYLLPFEIVSVHLLVVLIGAAYLARAKRRREAVA